MSKSIYEETISILNSRIADGEVKSFKVTGETYEKITSTLKKAQKQEKLLELYRIYIRELENMNSIYNAEICEHVKLYHIKDGMLDKYNDTTNKILKEIRELIKQIKELEK